MMLICIPNQDHVRKFELHMQLAKWLIPGLKWQQSIRQQGRSKGQISWQILIWNWTMDLRILNMIGHQTGHRSLEFQLQDKGGSWDFSIDLSITEAVWQLPQLLLRAPICCCLGEKGAWHLNSRNARKNVIASFLSWNREISRVISADWNNSMLLNQLPTCQVIQVVSG